jgi:outer membrane lipoprotein-sorting protein
MNKHWISLIGVLVLGMVISGCADKKTENEDNGIDNTAVTNNAITSTSDWKTYTNNKYGYSIKYPNSMMLSSQSTDNHVGWSDNITKDGRGVFSIEISLNSNKLSLDEFFNQTVEHLMGEAKPNDVTTTNITIDNKAAKKFNIINSGDSKGSVGAVMIANSNLIKISGEDRTIFDSVVGTFKFTK